MSPVWGIECGSAFVNNFLNDPARIAATPARELENSEKKLDKSDRAAARTRTDQAEIQREYKPFTVSGIMENIALTIQEIQEFIPHRYPFLLVDKILEFDAEAKRMVGLKNVTFNEPFFQGHFPGVPIMPGVLIIEAMAQVSGILFLKMLNDGKKRLAYFAGIDQAKFRKPVRPGDQIRLELTVLHMRKNSYKVHGTASVENSVVAEADLLLISEIMEAK